MTAAAIVKLADELKKLGAEVQAYLQVKLK